jgi:hypothetical protein
VPRAGWQQRNAAVPLAVKPNAVRGPTLGGFVVHVDARHVRDRLGIDPLDQMVGVHPATWRWAATHPAVLGEFVHEQAEAVRTMQVRMLDVTRHRPPPPAPRRKPVLTEPSGIKALCTDLQQLVADLAGTDPADGAAMAEVAQRYGRARDSMRELRSAFSEAEGSFETAQALLLAKLGVDE